MADGSSVPVWTETQDWNKVLLNSVILAGTAEIEDLSSEIDVEHKKAKGSEKPTSKDNGNKVGEFRIILTLTEYDWDEFQSTFHEWHPRRLGRERSPVNIIHPLVNLTGITQVRIIGVKFPKSPTARDGLKVTISVAEWFDKPVSVAKTTKHSAPNHDEFLVDPSTRSNQFNRAITDFPNLDPAPNPNGNLSDLHEAAQKDQDRAFKTIFGDGPPLI